MHQWLTPCFEQQLEEELSYSQNEMQRKMKDKIGHDWKLAKCFLFRQEWKTLHPPRVQKQTVSSTS